jgi:hypothetical protein
MALETGESGASFGDIRNNLRIVTFLRADVLTAQICSFRTI